MRYFLSDEVVAVLIVEVHCGVLRQVVCLHVLDFHRNLASGKFLGHDGCLLNGIELSCRVDSALKTERRVGLKSVTAGRLAYPCGMEIG